MHERMCDRTFGKVSQVKCSLRDMASKVRGKEPSQFLHGSDSAFAVNCKTFYERACDPLH